MNIELFTLCDGAYNYNGKLTIVGTLDVMNAESVPATAVMLNSGGSTALWELVSELGF